MLKFVVDASVAIKLYKKEEDSEIARELFERANKDFQLYAPDIIVYEIANRLKMEYTKDEAYKMLRSFINDYLSRLTPIFMKGWTFGMDERGYFGLVLPRSYEEKDLFEALKIAKDHNITFYDATYMMLARKFTIKLVTADKQVLNEFPDDTISLRDLPF